MNLQNFLSSIQSNTELSAEVDLTEVLSVVDTLISKLPIDLEAQLQLRSGKRKVELVDLVMKISLWHRILQSTYERIQKQRDSGIVYNMLSVLERRMPSLQTLQNMEEDFI